MLVLREFLSLNYFIKKMKGVARFYSKGSH